MRLIQSCQPGGGSQDAGIDEDVLILQVVKVHLQYVHANIARTFAHTYEVYLSL